MIKSERKTVRDAELKKTDHNENFAESDGGERLASSERAQKEAN